MLFHVDLTLEVLGNTFTNVTAVYSLLQACVTLAAKGKMVILFFTWTTVFQLARVQCLAHPLKKRLRSWRRQISGEK